MKRFTKISLIAAAVLTVLGIVGVGVGFLFGAKPSQLAQNLPCSRLFFCRDPGT